MASQNKAPKRPKQPKSKGKKAVRQEIVDLHRKIFKRNQARINGSVSGYTAAFRRYENQYRRHVRSYSRRTTVAALDRAVASSELVYVGDYHTLPQAQRAFLRLLRRVPQDRPVIVALEFIEGRHQRVLDSYIADEISEEQYLATTEHANDWAFGGWPSFKSILDLARARGHRVIGIDTRSSGPAGSSLQARDGYAARRIDAARRKQPDALCMVLIGELHIAPPHLPAEVVKLSKRSGKTTLPSEATIIYQNCENIYWQLEERGLEHEVEIVRLRDKNFCIMNTPPIVCQQSFLNWMGAAEDGVQLEAPEENFREYVRLIAAFFDLPIGNAVDEVEIATVVDLSFLERLRRGGDFSPREMQQIKDQVLRSESYYIPRARMVYLGNLSVNHASEEATHFLRHVCAQAHEPRMLIDAFYARVLEEVVGFLGSKLMNHKRKTPRARFFQRVMRRKSATGPERHLAALVLKHHNMISGKRVKNMEEVYECGADLFNALTHTIGYQLGDLLYYALITGEVSKETVRELFFEPFTEEGEALTTYLHLTIMTRDVRVPDRM